MIRKIILLIGIFCLINTVRGQQKWERTLSYWQLWQEIYACKKVYYSISNALIVYSEADKARVDSLHKKQPRIEVGVNISQCKFTSKELDYLGREVVDVKINDLIFEKQLSLSSNEGIVGFMAKRTRFEKGLIISDNGDDVEDIWVVGCQINGLLILKQSNEDAQHRLGLHILYSSVELTQTKNNKKYQTARNSTIAINALQSKITIDKSNFSTDTTINCLLMQGAVQSLEIDSTTFEVDVDLKDFAASEHIGIHNSSFRMVDWYGTQLPSAVNMNVRFDQFKQHLSIYEERSRMVSDSEIIEGRPAFEFLVFDRYVYRGLSAEDQKNIKLYDELMALYGKFYKIYRERVDLESANRCYVVMKQLQTARLAYLYKQNGSIDNWMYWQLNVFLEYFCDYLTSPVKALLVSMWTILQFACLYFFFYSNWDQINRKFLVAKHRKLLHYFRSQQSLEEFYTATFKDEHAIFEAYKKELREGKKEVPFFMYWLGKPLYHFSMIRHRLTQWWYKRTEILSGRWIDLSVFQKITVGSRVFVALLFYLCYLFLVRAANSIILSINAFSTLGFGNIPVQGALRYITILEGFLGWFLLSIFSVSLISQILQS